MKKCYVLLNHSLTEDQVKNLKEEYGVDFVQDPDAYIKSLWSNLPIDDEIDMVIVNKIISWFSGMDDNDIAVVQGEHTYSFIIVDYLLKRGNIVLSSVSNRITLEEKKDDSVLKYSLFKHICFRAYKSFPG